MADDENPNFSPPRSIETFGVSGLLQEGCRVFYDSIFTTRHLGRVADLLSARLQKAGPDELRLRALLLFLAYEGFRAQFPVDLVQSKEDEDSDLALRTPLTIECGIDGEKIVVGVAFDPHPSQSVDINGLEERIRTRAGACRIENALIQLLGHSPAVYFRRQPSTGKLELAATIGIRERAFVKDGTGFLSLHEIPEAPEATPKAAQYAELGDEDYEKLLKDESKGRGDGDEDDESSKKFTGDDDADDGDSKVGGKEEKEKESKRKFAGKGRGADSERTVSGGEEDDDEGGAGGTSSGDAESDDAQKVGGRDPKRKGRMKSGAADDEEEVAEDEEDVRLGKGDDRKKGGRKLGVKSSQSEPDAEESDEDQVRLGSSGTGAKSRKIGVKGSQGDGSGDGDVEDDEVLLGDGKSGGKKRSAEERAADDKAIREFDDSTFDPSNISAEQVERYKEQIRRMSRKLTDLEEDRAKWMRMVKSESTKGNVRLGDVSQADGAAAPENGESEQDEGMKLKRLQSAKRPDEASAEDEDASDEQVDDDKMRVRKLKNAKSEKDGLADSENVDGEESSEEAEEQKKKPVGFLKRLFGGGQDSQKKESKRDEEDEDLEERSRSKSRDSEEEGDAPKSKKKKKGFFGLGREEESDEEEGSESKKDSKGDEAASGKSDAVEEEDEGVDADSKKSATDDPAEKAEDLANDIESGTFHKKMEKSKEELEAIRARMKDERVKNWADGMMADIMKEKARLGEMARNLNQAFRTREAEFNRKTQFMKQEILNREDQIRKGHLSVARVREQLALSNSNSERLKVQISNLETQESAARQKFQAAERLAQVAKEETSAMQRQVDNLKQQALQSGSQGKKLELVQKELIASKAQVEKAMKLADDLKRANLQLTEKVNVATQATSGAGGTEDLKRKLEAAGRLTAAHKKEAETFKTKMEGSLKEEARLRSEVTKLQAELKRMKALSNMAGGAPASAAVAPASGTPAAAPKKPGTPGGKAA